jgi:TRAP-type uncharacterized transport system substrate-binding protein
MAADLPAEGKKRVLGIGPERGGLSRGLKTLLFFGAVAVFGAVLALTDPQASLRHLKVGILSGTPRGNYHAVVQRVAAGAAARKGRVTSLASAGSVENVQRLDAARKGCSAHFALVQEGVELPAGHGLELIGRLTRPESLVILGRNADRIGTLGDFRGLRVGIGPVGSGTEFVSRKLLAPFGALQVQLSTQSIDEQIQKLERGELDLGAMVIDEDADQLRDAVRDGKLQILGLPRADAVASGLPFLRVGRIEAGHYDPIASVPPTDKAVLEVDTLLVGNGCASRSATQGLITVLSDLDPLFLKHNKETANLTGLPWSSVARSYYDSGAPDVVGVYAPWVVDIMPTASWVQLALGLSLLLNVMGGINRFRLWRLDADRVAIEKSISGLFGGGITVGELPRAHPLSGLPAEETRERLLQAMRALEALYGRCRTQSLSIFVPMGGEMAYRYQENLMMDLLQALRAHAEFQQPVPQQA